MLIQKCNWTVKADKYHVSDPYQRCGLLPTGFFKTGEEVKKFIEEKVEKYKSHPEHYLVFKVERAQDACISEDKLC